MGRRTPGGDQGLLPGMPTRLYPCTPTRLGTWLDCPRRYRFGYLDRPAPPKGPPWAHNSIGSAVHSALADWWGLPFAQRLPARGIDLVRKRWITDGFPDAEEALAARERAAIWVEEYLLRVDPADEPIGVERTVAAPTARLAVSGRVDRIDLRPDGRLAIVDYKTGRRPPGPDDVRGSLALALYAVAASRTLRRECSRVELHHVPTGEVVAHDHTPSSLARKIDEAESIAYDCSRADAAHASGRTGDDVFPPRPSRLCGWCDYRRHCPEGRAATPGTPV
ncbi:MAG: putative RecB family exonuclease [Actinomycetota bacterium]|nr:putative RecB family exonuclease [Actinomycetota bacterium]